jgi:hypothetical protein
MRVSTTTRPAPAQSCAGLHHEMREACPVVHSRQYGGFAMLTRYDDVRHVWHSPGAFSSADGVFIPPSRVPGSRRWSLTSRITRWGAELWSRR